jgi:hypothetical protein
MRPSLLLLAFSVLGLEGCATQPEVLFLAGPRRQNSGEQDIAALILFMQRVGKHGACAYAHGSEPGRGPPVNSREEQTFDQFPACGWTWGGKPR